MTKIFAHRGYSSKYPENTMLAFMKAEEAGVDGIELDLQLSKDGQLVICHDEDVDRTSDSFGYIREYDLSELKAMSFHNGMDEFKNYEDIKIPSLEEYFEWFKSKDLITNIELKTGVFRYRGIVDKTVELIKKYRLEERIIISSANHLSIKEVKKKGRGIKTAVLSSNCLIDPEEYCRMHGIDYYHPSYLALEDDTIKKCHRRSVGVNVWTIDSEVLMEKMFDQKADGIITNEASLGVKLRDSFLED